MMCCLIKHTNVGKFFEKIEKGRKEKTKTKQSQRKRNVIYNNSTLKQVGNEKKMMIILHE